MFHSLFGFRCRYALHDNSTTPAARVPGIPGLFSGYALSLQSNHLVAPRASVPGITNISGLHATVTLAAWLKVGNLHGGGFVGGVWNEARAWRQFALFLNLPVCGKTPNGTVAHISGTGGPEAGRQYCNSAACGGRNLGDGKWHCVANVYNSTAILAYVDGELDNFGEIGRRKNPFKYPNPPDFPGLLCWVKYFMANLPAWLFMEQRSRQLRCVLYAGPCLKHVSSKNCGRLGVLPSHGL